MNSVLAGFRSNATNWLAFSLKVALTGVCIGFLWKAVDAEELKAVLLGAKLEWVMVGLACGIPVMVASGLRWRLISAYLKVDIPSRFAVFGYMEAIALNIVLPGSVGGDIVRIAKVTRARGHLRRNIVAVLLDRFANLGILLVICIPGLFLVTASRETGPLRTTLIALLIGFSAVIACGILAIRLRPLRRYRLVRECVHIATLFWRMLLPPSRILLIASWSLLAQGMAVAMFMASAFAVGIADLSLFEAAVATMLALLAAALPITVAGLGVREGTLIWTLLQFGVSQPHAYSAAILFAACLICQAVPGLVLMLTGYATLDENAPSANARPHPPASR